MTFTSQAKTWGAAPSTPVADRIDLTATNVRSVDLDVTRAHVDCNVTVNITSDGPIDVNLLGCNRTISGGGGAGEASGPSGGGTPGVKICTKKRKAHGKRGKKRRGCGRKHKKKHH